MLGVQSNKTNTVEQCVLPKLRFSVWWNAWSVCLLGYRMEMALVFFFYSLVCFFVFLCVCFLLCFCFVFNLHGI